MPRTNMRSTIIIVTRRLSIQLSFLRGSRPTPIVGGVPIKGHPRPSPRNINGLILEDLYKEILKHSQGPRTYYVSLSCKYALGREAPLVSIDECKSWGCRSRVPGGPKKLTKLVFLGLGSAVLQLNSARCMF